MSGKRIYFQESVSGATQRIPFLARFQKENGVLSLKLINKYMGFRLLLPDDSVSSFVMNKVLEEAERRGDL